MVAHTFLLYYLDHRLRSFPLSAFEGVVVLGDKAAIAAVPFDCGIAFFYREKCMFQFLHFITQYFLQDSGLQVNFDTDSIIVIFYMVIMLRGHS